jgi:ribokinase
VTRIAVVGHVEWVDFIPVARLPQPGEVVHASGAFARAAGGGSVVAAVLADLGAEVDFFCALGRDPLGEAASAQLTQRGISVHAAWRQEPTRRAFTLLDELGERTIVTVGDRLAPAACDPLEWGRIRTADGVYFTAGDAEALRLAREAPVVVASPRARGALLGQGPPVDALVFSAHDGSERDWAQQLATRTRLLVATEGARGGRWWGVSEGRWSALPAPGPPRDAYGCGDSFAAGFTLGLASGAPLADAAALGARCGARCLTQRGAP